MCGICGFNWTDTDLTARMMAVQEHRGPDDSGAFADERVSLGHRRLSIIDLTEAGRQPMASADGRLQIVYNGEVYNYVELADDLRRLGHTFHTRTDTEVVLHAYQQWGEACLERFNGMFAFAVYDEPKGRLFLARDRFGIKPLPHRPHVFRGHHVAAAGRVRDVRPWRAAPVAPPMVRDSPRSAAQDPRRTRSGGDVPRPFLRRRPPAADAL